MSARTCSNRKTACYVASMHLDLPRPALSSFPIERDRPAANDKWRLDEVVVPIDGVKFWLWRAVDANGDVLDILLQKQRNAKAASRFLKRLIDRFGTPRVVIIDKLRSYTKPVRHLAPGSDHRAHKGLDNCIEGSR